MSIFLIMSTFTPLYSFGETKAQDPHEPAKVALGYCVAGLVSSSNDAASVDFPDGSTHYLNSCSEMLKVAAEKGYTKIRTMTITASEKIGAPPVESFVIANSGKNPKNPVSSAVLFCHSSSHYPQMGWVNDSNGSDKQGKCAMLLMDLTTAGYSIVPELTVSYGGVPSYIGTTYVFVKE